MKLALTALIAAFLLIVDQMKTGGHYRTATLNGIEKAVTRSVNMFR